MYLVKTNSLGDTIWTKTFGGTDYDAAYAVKQTTDGGFIISGISEETVMLIKTDENGKIE